jgi:hypothetical protein
MTPCCCCDTNEFRFSFRGKLHSHSTLNPGYTECYIISSRRRKVHSSWMGWDVAVLPRKYHHDYTISAQTVPFGTVEYAVLPLWMYSHISYGRGQPSSVFNHLFFPLKVCGYQQQQAEQSQTKRLYLGYGWEERDHHDLTTLSL